MELIVGITIGGNINLSLLLKLLIILVSLVYLSLLSYGIDMQLPISWALL